MSNFTPRPYQHIGIEFALEHERNSIMARMGMGKTPLVLKLIDILMMCGQSQPTLVIAPKRVASYVWTNEAAKWDDLKHLEISPIVGTEKQRIEAIRKDVPIYTTNYEQLPWLIERFGSRWPFEHVVADESSKLKSLRISAQTSKKGNDFLRKGSGGGKRADALAKIAFKYIKRYTGLTGTPASLGLQDLWGQMWFIDGGQRLGRSYTAFEQRWFRPSYSGFGIEPFAHSQDEIQNLIKDVCLALDPKDWFDLREPIRIPVRVELPSKARELYRDMEKEFFMELESGVGIEAVNAGAKSMKCRQVAAGFAYTDETRQVWDILHDQKLQALESIYDQSGGTPLLVAYQFQAELDMLKKAFPKGRVLGQDFQTIKDFNAGKIPMLFAHPQSAGHGVDGLQFGSNIVVFFGHDWNLENREQFIERIGPVRQLQAGIERDVYIYDIIAEDTIDEIMIKRHETKAAVQQLLIDAMKKRKLLLAL